MAFVPVKMTLEEYLRLGESNRPCELIDGELFMPPSPNAVHQTTVLRLAAELRAHVTMTGLGRVFVAPLDVVLDRERPLVVQPDIVFVSHERGSIIQDRIEGAPGLIVEVCSPSSAVRDRSIKPQWYAQYGVREYWLVDPNDRLVEVRSLHREGFEVAGVYRDGDELSSRLLTDFRCVVSSVFS